ncbi:Hypothetical predicted protein [Pelobates cultripes]|uniref:Uncharacterized protein n=1 Tax=Pelobates cultripes TaxID=61616 RepID=A0AAD1VM72_PELCU|nr:Hypothetical predicted protein [Pelobates cultripes]
MPSNEGSTEIGEECRKRSRKAGTGRHHEGVADILHSRETMDVWAKKDFSDQGDMREDITQIESPSG